jgi:hypothetical protein
VSRFNLLKPKTLLPPALKFRNFVLPTIHLCFAWVSEQTAIFSLYTNNFSAFITEAERVYFLVRTEPLNQLQFLP